MFEGPLKAIIFFEALQRDTYNFDNNLFRYLGTGNKYVKLASFFILINFVPMFPSISMLSRILQSWPKYMR